MVMCLHKKNSIKFLLKYSCYLILLLKYYKSYFNFFFKLGVKFKFYKYNLKYLKYTKVLKIKNMNEKILKNHKCEV